MDPKLTSLYEEICDLDEISARARELKSPQDCRSVELGHCVTVENKTGSVLKFHICSELDVKYQGDINSAAGRMLSRESELGKKICGQKVGSKISQGVEEFTIKEIEVSEFLMQ